jgi:hypothetical protein
MSWRGGKSLQVKRKRKPGPRRKTIRVSKGRWMKWPMRVVEETGELVKSSRRPIKDRKALFAVIREMAKYAPGIRAIPDEVWNEFIRLAPLCECGAVPSPRRCAAPVTSPFRYCTSIERARAARRDWEMRKRRKRLQLKFDSYHMANAIKRGAIPNL